MSVVIDNVVFYQSADMVTGDGVTIGGSVNFSGRLGFSDVSGTTTMEVVSSSGSDTATVVSGYGRDSTGIIQSISYAANGTTPVSATQTFQRLLQGQVTGTAPVGDIAWMSTYTIVTGTAQSAGNTSGVVGPYIQLSAGQGASAAINQIIRITNNTPSTVQFQLRRIVGLSGSTDFVFVNEDWGTTPTSSTQYEIRNGMLFEQSPNKVTNIIRIFYNCAADVPGGSNRNYYSKGFIVNNNTSTSLTTAGVSLVSAVPALPAGATLQFGLASGLNDNETATNRQTAPSNITFTTGSMPVSSGIPGAGNLPAGTAPNTSGAQGIWFNLSLLSGTAPYDGFSSITVSGTTT